jgi:hypothetical protein
MVGEVENHFRNLAQRLLCDGSLGGAYFA